MTNAYIPPTAPPNTNTPGTSTSETVREQAGQLGHQAADEAANIAGTAKDEAGRVAGTAKDEAGKVVGESRKQAKALFDEAREQLTEQAGVQQQRVASGLRDIGDELNRMAQSSGQNGVAGDLVSQAASRTSGIAEWLDGRDPGTLLTEVRDFARRRPGTFIAVSAVAGLVAGRLVKSLASDAADDRNATLTTPAPAVDRAAVPPAPAAGDTPLFDQVSPSTYAPSATDGRQP
jgi:ElaB/YqjD/DUF883 family membrane-anchored ribosome-binding protein